MTYRGRIIRYVAFLVNRQIYLIEHQGKKNRIYALQKGLSTKQHLPLCLHRPSISLPEQLQLQLAQPGAHHVSLEQGSHGDRCVLHEYFSLQMGKVGKVAGVIVGVE